MWLALLIIILGFFLYQKYKEHEEKKKPILPPDSTVYIFGCNGAVDCGYWSPEMVEKSNGEIEINAKKCYCAYKKQWLRQGDKCFFEQDHPEQIRKSTFEDPDFN